MRKIKLCPLCGGEAELDGYGFSLYFVRCGDCNATGPAFEDKESAIKAWNKRYNWLGAFKKKLVRLIAQWIKEE